MAVRPLAMSTALLPSATRRSMAKAMVHMAYSTPAQFSSFIGQKMLLPECYIRRGCRKVAGMLRKPAQMSFLGVGAPEAILVGVVALVVFGPKGLADAAKSVGQALRSFQPTIKEVVSVSQELKGTLEKELGLDELRDAARPIPLPRTPEPLPMLQAVDPDIEKKRAESAQMAWGGGGGVASPADAPSPAAATSEATPTVPPPASSPAKDLATMSVDELEAELARRKAGVAGGAKA